MVSPEVTGRKIGVGEVAAYRIPEFCRAHGISPAFFFKLQTAGLGPRVMRVGSRVLISKESAAAWRRERELATAQGEA